MTATDVGGRPYDPARGAVAGQPRNDSSHACTPSSFGFAQADGGAKASPGAIVMTDRTGAPRITRQPEALVPEAVPVGS